MSVRSNLTKRNKNSRRMFSSAVKFIYVLEIRLITSSQIGSRPFCYQVK